MRHDHLIGQASDQASDLVGQADAGDHDDKSNAKAQRTNRVASESLGSGAITGTNLAAITQGAAADRPRPDCVLRTGRTRRPLQRQSRADQAEQQLPDPRLHLVGHRAPRRTHVPRRTIATQRLPHRVLRTPHRPSDHLDISPRTYAAAESQPNPPQSAPASS